MSEAGGFVTGYPRDASWWNRPDVRSPKKLHRPSARVADFAHCQPTKIMICLDMPHSMSSSSPALCRRCFPSAH